MKNEDLQNNGLQGLDFDLPEELIAKRPLDHRSDARLLIVDASDGKLALEDRHVRDLPELLSPGDRIVLNSTRVSPRRVILRRTTGARIEALFLDHCGDGNWSCLLRNLRKLKPGESLVADQAGDIEFQVLDLAPSDGGNAMLRPILKSNQQVAWPTREAAERSFEEIGEIPLPPYLDRPADETDNRTYQTVFARQTGSVAAPTAGLHFTFELLERLRTQGVQQSFIELCVGYGTFAPLTEDQIERGELHPELYHISESVASELNRLDPARIVAIGTTTLRALEANLRAYGSYQGGSHATRLFLQPPDRPGATGRLLTNFHLPGSSLIYLVASMLGVENTRATYEYAIRERYRFYSYGDAMLIKSS